MAIILKKKVLKMFSMEPDWSKFRELEKQITFEDCTEYLRDKGNPLRDMILQSKFDYNTGGYFELCNIQWHN